MEIYNQVGWVVLAYIPFQGQSNRQTPKMCSPIQSMGKEKNHSRDLETKTVRGYKWIMCHLPW